MDVSKFLSKVMGLYLLLVAWIMLLNQQQFLTHLQNLIRNHELIFITGFFTMILGLLMVVSHNIWQWHWRLMITMVAWISLLKGLSLLLYPQWIADFTLLFIQNKVFFNIVIGFDFVFGTILTYLGFKREY